MAHNVPAPAVHGLMAEFASPVALVAAAEKARLAGYKKMDAYTPIPIEELEEALGLKRTRLPILVFLGGLMGGLGGFGLERRGVDGFALLAPDDEIGQRLGSRQAAGVGGENAVGAGFHDALQDMNMLAVYRGALSRGSG